MLEKEKMGIEERLPPGSRLEPTKLQLLKQYLEKKTFDTDKLKAEYNKEHNTKAQAITKRLTKDINKVVHSLTAIDKSGFEDSTKAAFAKPFLFIGSKDNKLHAEMKILDYLDVTGQIDTKNPENIQDIEPIYIGISKMCCLNCEATVQALNQYPSLKIIEIDASDDEQEQAATEKHATRPQAKTSIAALETADQTPRTPRRTTEHSAAAAATKESPIQTRGAHLQGFPHWTQPHFLKQNPLLLKMYNERRLLLSKETNTKHIPGDSPTPIKKEFVRPPLDLRPRNLEHYYDSDEPLAEAVGSPMQPPFREHMTKTAAFASGKVPPPPAFHELLKESDTAAEAGTEQKTVARTKDRHAAVPLIIEWQNLRVQSHQQHMATPDQRVAAKTPPTTRHRQQPATTANTSTPGHHDPSKATPTTKRKSFVDALGVTPSHRSDDKQLEGSETRFRQQEPTHRTAKFLNFTSPKHSPATVATKKVVSPASATKFAKREEEKTAKPAGKPARK